MTKNKQASMDTFIAGGVAEGAYVFGKTPIDRYFFFKSAFAMPTSKSHYASLFYGNCIL